MLEPPPYLKRIISLQRQVSIVDGKMVDSKVNTTKEDFVPYLTHRGPYKCGERIPIVVSVKTCLRERGKQDIYVAKHCLVYQFSLLGLNPKDLSKSKLEWAEANNIRIVVPDMKEFRTDKFEKNIRPKCFNESMMWEDILKRLIEFK